MGRRASLLGAAGYRARSGQGPASVSFVTMVTDYEATLPTGTTGYTTPTQAQATAVADAWDLLVAGDLTGAQALVSAYHFTVDQITDTVTGRSFRRMRETPLSGGAFQQAWGMYVYSPSAPYNVVVECAHPVADARAAEVSADLFIRSNARAFFMAGAHRDAGGSTGDKDTDPADVANFNGVTVFLEVHNRTLSWTNSYTIQPHGFTDSTVPEYVVMSTSSAGPNRWTRKIMSAYQDLGYTNGFMIKAFSDSQDTRLTALGNEQAKKSYLAGRRFLHVEHNPTVRAMDAVWQAGNQAIADAIPLAGVTSTLPTFVRQATATSGSGTTLALAVPVTASTAGNCLVATVAMRTDTGRQVGSITDTAGNLWQQAAESHPGSGSSTRTETWIALNTASTTSVTINLIGGAALKAAANVSEWADVETWGAFDNATSVSGATVTAADSGQVIPLDDNTLLIAAINSTTIGTTRTFASSGSGWTELTRYETTGGTDAFGATAWKTLPTPAATQAQWTHAATINYSGSTVALRGRTTSTESATRQTSTLTRVGHSAWAHGTTSCAPAYPSSVTSGDAVYLDVHTKPETVVPTEPTGFVFVATAIAGTTALTGVDTGPTRISRFKRVATSALSGTVTVTCTGASVCSGSMVAYRITEAGSRYEERYGAWTVPTTGTTGATTLNGPVAGVPVQSGDIVDLLVGVGSDSTTAVTMSAVAAVGATLSTPTQDPTGVGGNTTTGDDLGIFGFYSPVTAGSSVGPLRVTASQDVANTMTGLVTRTRATRPV